MAETKLVVRSGAIVPRHVNFQTLFIGHVTYHAASTVTTFTGLRMWALFWKCTKSITCHTCQNRKHDIPQNQNDTTINHMNCTHMQFIFDPPFYLVVEVLPNTGLQSDCEHACTDAEFATYEAFFVRCWQLGKIHNHITSSHNLKPNTFITKQPIRS
jgi:hypothetical protein